MGSRIRENPDHLFEVFTEVARPGQQGDHAFVLQKYPDEFNDQKALESEVPKFAFPSQAESNAVDHFSFVLTDEEGKFRFGFCRHAAGSQTCLCIVSFLPWFEMFYRLLNLLAEILNRSNSDSVTPVLDRLYKRPIPKAGEKVEITTDINTETFAFITPNPNELPTIPQNRNLTEYYNAVDVSTMLKIFAGMLQERRILITSRKLSRLTACIHGSASLLYPMYWQHIYIPVLPAHLIDYCSAPMPYLIGIHESLFQKLKPVEVGDAVVINVDIGTVESDFNDLEILPADVLSSLKKKLKALSAEKMAVSPMGDGVARAFLLANVSLIGGYRQALRFPPGERITFDEDAFVHSRPNHMQPFLQKMLHAQLFEQFVNDRLDKLIAGEGFSDEFDNEVNMEQDKWATQSRYKEWYGHVKIQGKKFRKDGRENWIKFSSKANPAMRGAMKAVRDKSKKAVKDIRLKIDELRKEDLNKSGVSRHRPATIESPALRAQRPPRPPPMDHSSVLGPDPAPRNAMMRSTSYERAKQYKVISVDEMDDVGPVSKTRPRSPPAPTSPSYRGYPSLVRHSRHSRKMASEDTDIIADMTFQRVSLDLLGDQDIQTMLKKSYSLEDLSAPLEEEEDYDDDDEDEDDEIDYRTLNPAAVTEEESGQPEGCPEKGQDMLIVIEDNVPVTQDVNANRVLPQFTPEIHRKASVTSVTSSASSQTTNYNLETNEQTDKPSVQPQRQEQNAPIPPKRKPRKSDGLRKDSAAALGSGRQNTQSQKGDSSGAVPLAFEDNFVPSVGAPVIPPKAPIKSPQQPAPPSGQSQPSANVKNTASVANSSTTAIPQRDAPVPKRRTSINRKPAFYNEQRPPSFRNNSVGSKPATDAQAIKHARSAFIQSEGKSPVIQKRDELDQFDPLVTGQLALDNRHNDKNSAFKEDDLLKEWNLNFETKTKVRPHRVPPVPPKPNSPQGTMPVLFGSSPVLNAYPGAGVRHGYNMSPVHRVGGPRYPGSAASAGQPRWNQMAPGGGGPRWQQPGTQLQTQHQSVQLLIQQFSPAARGTSHSTVPGRPMSQVVMRDKSQDPGSLSQRPMSMYVEGPQDPFSQPPIADRVQTQRGATLPNGASPPKQAPPRQSNSTTDVLQPHRPPSNHGNSTTDVLQPHRPPSNHGNSTTDVLQPHRPPSNHGNSTTDVLQPHRPPSQGGQSWEKFD